MNCKKCGSQNENKNFCGNCSNPLKEKCLECGEMELIGRRFCEDKACKIELYIMKYANKYNRFIPILFTTGGLGPLILFAVSEIYFGQRGNTDAFYRSFIIASVFFSIVIVMTACLLQFWLPKRIKKAREEFFRIHPEYAEYEEIIKKEAERIL